MVHSEESSESSKSNHGMNFNLKMFLGLLPTFFSRRGRAWPGTAGRGKARISIVTIGHIFSIGEKNMKGNIHILSKKEWRIEETGTHLILRRKMKRIRKK